MVAPSLEIVTSWRWIVRRVSYWSLVLGCGGDGVGTYSDIVDHHLVQPHRAQRRPNHIRNRHRGRSYNPQTPA